MPGSSRAKREMLSICGGGTRNRIDIEKDTWREVQLVAQGKTYQEVADIMNRDNEGYSLTLYAVRADVERALVEWKRDNMDNIDMYIGLELARLEELQKKLMEDYEKSKSGLRPNEYAALMKRGLSMEEIDDWYKEHELPADPRFVETILHIQRQRMRLLGLDKGNDVAQSTIVNYNFDGISDERLESIAGALQDSLFESRTRGIVIDEQ